MIEEYVWYGSKDVALLKRRSWRFLDPASNDRSQSLYVRRISQLVGVWLSRNQSLFVKTSRPTTGITIAMTMLDRMARR